MRLVGSSTPGDVERDTAVRLLAERAVLTRAVCRELLEVGGGFAQRRPFVALFHLLHWVQMNFPASVRVEPHAVDGIDLMVVPAGCEDLIQEIRDGAEVGEALFMLMTADTPTQQRGDEARIQEQLTAYWAKHSAAVRAPTVIECWSGFHKDPGG